MTVIKDHLGYLEKVLQKFMLKSVKFKVLDERIVVNFQRHNTLLQGLVL